MISWRALVAGTTYVTGALTQGLLILNYPTYHPQRWHAALLFYAKMAFSLFVNTYLGRLLSRIESMILVFHVLGFFGILIPLVYLAPHHQSAQEVFTTFRNDGDWGTTGLAFFVGLIGSLSSFTGVDTADHIAEETQNAPTITPLSIRASTVLNGSLGFGMLIALLFCMPSDIPSLLNTETQYPFMNIYAYAVGSNRGATAMASIIVITQIFGCISLPATASRMMWAFAREEGLPFARYFGRVDQRTFLPLYAIGTTVVINLPLALINIGSSADFSAFLSLTVASYYSSFILAAAVTLHKRLTTPDSEIQWGPFKMGRAGVPVTIAALAFSILGGAFSMWPTENHPSFQEMSWCILVFGGALFFSLLFWVFYGRKHYTGPVLEI